MRWRDSHSRRRSSAAFVLSAVTLSAAIGGCRANRVDGGKIVPQETSEETETDTEGRLDARPAAPIRPAAETGPHPLELAPGRDGLVYVPNGYTLDVPAPLVVMLHGAGGNAEGGLAPLQPLADAAGLLLLAPESRGRTWDVIIGGFGPDVEFIDDALGQVFDSYNVDAERVAVAGFSDGASYALSLGLTNGELFSHVIAFSPGFMAPGADQGAPAIFISHGTGDDVLPIDRCSRRIVPALQRDGYEVDYREFEGGHTVPPEMAEAALRTFLDHQFG